MKKVAKQNGDNDNERDQVPLGGQASGRLPALVSRDCHFSLRSERARNVKENVKVHRYRAHKKGKVDEVRWFEL